MLYSLPPRTQSALRAKGCITRACSSDAIRHTQAMTVPWRAMFETNFSPQLLAPLPMPPRKIYAKNV